MTISHQIEQTILQSVAQLAQRSDTERRMLPRGVCAFPGVPALKDFMRHVRMTVFPDFMDRRRDDPKMREFTIGHAVEEIYTILAPEIAKALRFEGAVPREDIDRISADLTGEFIALLPEIKRLLLTDVRAMYENDPAVDNPGEIILCYPVMQAMTHYRTAHALLTLGIPLIPRILTELAHADTGIDIHPGAQIGEYFAIDHGTGVVIGQTCVIGRHVTLYQGVTLGAKNFTLDADGHPINLPRHPILEDHVTVYSNASILGRITVGHGSVIGGNVWLTHSVPPDSRILQQ